MEVDNEYPSKEYLAAARLSIEEMSHPGMPRIKRFSILSLESRNGAAGGINFQRGKYMKDPNAPNDKNNFVLMTITLFGLVHMLPFLFFMTANEYWMYKFRDTTSNSTDANDRTEMQRYFSSLTTLTITTPGVIGNFLAAIAGHKIKATTRVFMVLIIHSAILTFQAIMVEVDTDTWQKGFFITTLLSQLVMSSAISIGGSGSMGLIARLPPKYMKAKLMGEGVAGVFSALLRLLFIFISPSVTGAALMYFIVGSILMTGTTFIFWLATRTKFFKYYTDCIKEDVKENFRDKKDMVEVFKKIWPLILLQCIPILIPYSSLSTLVVSETNGVRASVWGDKYFVTICTYLIPAVTGLIGRGLFNKLDVELSFPVLSVIVIVKEVIIGGLSLVTNAKPRKNLPVLLTKDWEYGLLMAGHLFFSGFLMNLMMIKSMRLVPPNRIELGMMITMFFISIFSAVSSPLGVVVVSLL